MSNDALPPSGVRLAEVMAALSVAIDLGYGQSLGDGLRSCLVAVRLGESLGLSERELTAVYYLALVRHLGCTADAHLGAAVFGDEVASYRWFASVDFGDPEQVIATLASHIGEGEPPSRQKRMLKAALARAPQMLMAAIPAHCEVGQLLAKQLGLSPAIQEALGQVFERWDGRGLPRGLKREAISRPLRVVLLAHDAQVFYALGGGDAAMAMARQRAGGAHDPWIVEGFCRQAPQLLAALDQEPDWDALLDAEPGPVRTIAEGELDSALAALADFSDLKAPCFSGHSRGVAALAAASAEGARLPQSEAVAMRRAGLLHDLGRVGITSRIWTKAGPLSTVEWERVRLHPYYTERVLARWPHLAYLSSLAALHHERLDASGYYRGAPASLLPLGARILAAADTYHALTEPRPHRRRAPQRKPLMSWGGRSRRGGSMATPCGRCWGRLAIRYE